MNTIYKWNNKRVTIRVKRVLDTELKVSNRRELKSKLAQDITILWRIPNCNVEAIKDILKLAYN